MSAPERIWAASVTENYGEWQTTTDGLPRPTEYVRADLYAALEAQLAERVKVKTLEWTRGWMNAEAQTEIGQYTITYRRDGSFEWGIGILKGWASSWDEAKAAAQADFDRRILSSLEATPPAPKVTDEMVERACRVHNVGWSLWKEPQKKTAREVMRAALQAAQEAGKP